jgi:Hydantoinase/oxoprolinase N-terminal region
MQSQEFYMMKWQFWIDRGGTFTDIVAQRPDGEILVHKLLSENPGRYEDAPIQGIRDLLGLAADQPIPAEIIASLPLLLPFFSRTKPRQSSTLPHADIMPILALPQALCLHIVPRSIMRVF